MTPVEWALLGFLIFCVGFGMGQIYAARQRSVREKAIPTYRGASGAQKLTHEEADELLAEVLDESEKEQRHLSAELVFNRAVGIHRRKRKERRI